MTKKYTPSQSIGILGGMGPAASADFYRRLIDIAQHVYGADQDTDFPPMYLYNLPLSGFDETGFTNSELVRDQLVEGVKKLAAFGSDSIVIPCNTVHVFYDDMQQAVTVPIISIINAVVDIVLLRRFKVVGLLSSESTKKYDLYEKAFKTSGVQVLAPDEQQQKKVNAVIHRVMSGSQDESDVAVLKSIILDFVAAGAEVIVLGCTELPLAITQKDIDIPIVSSTDILARTVLARVYAQK